MAQDTEIFDRRAVRRHRARAAAGLTAHDFLVREIAARLADRLDDVTRRFARVLEIGAWHGALRAAVGAREGTETVISMDLAPALPADHSVLTLVGDEERLPFADASFDAVVSFLGLHQVNDLPGALIQIRRALKPDGLFLAACFGGETLKELRHALLAGESRVRPGARPRIGPFVDVRDAGALLQRAGFALPMVDLDRITVRYEDPARLLADLKGMGECNVLQARSRALTPPSVLAATCAAYRELYGADDGRVPATFDVLFLTGWAPHPDQPQPLSPGSATASLADALKTGEDDSG